MATGFVSRRSIRNLSEFKALSHDIASADGQAGLAALEKVAAALEEDSGSFDILTIAHIRVRAIASTDTEYT